MAARKSRKPRARGLVHKVRVFEPHQVTLGDRIRVERRFIVDGELTRVADQGVFHGVQAMGSVEHILLETQGEVRLIPLPTVSEIVLESTDERPGEGFGRGPFDPSFA